MGDPLRPVPPRVPPCKRPTKACSNLASIELSSSVHAVAMRAQLLLALCVTLVMSFVAPFQLPPSRHPKSLRLPPSAFTCIHGRERLRVLKSAPEDDSHDDDVFDEKYAAFLKRVLDKESDLTRSTKQLLNILVCSDAVQQLLVKCEQFGLPTEIGVAGGVVSFFVSLLIAQRIFEGVPAKAYQVQILVTYSIWCLLLLSEYGFLDVPL